MTAIVCNIHGKMELLACGECLQDNARKLLVAQVALRTIRTRLIGIGGPLNDNVLRFNSDQLRLFHQIEQDIQEARA